MQTTNSTYPLQNKPLRQLHTGGDGLQPLKPVLEVMMSIAVYLIGYGVVNQEPSCRQGSHNETLASQLNDLAGTFTKKSPFTFII